MVKQKLKDSSFLNYKPKHKNVLTTYIVENKTLFLKKVTLTYRFPKSPQLSYI